MLIGETKKDAISVESGCMLYPTKFRDKKYSLIVDLRGSFSNHFMDDLKKLASLKA